MPDPSFAIPARLLQGATNFRDLGGLPAAGGLRVRRGWLYRSDHLAQLDAAEQQRLRALGIRSSIDFRGVHERTQAAYAIEGIDKVDLPIEPVVSQRLHDLVLAGGQPTAQQTLDWMQDTYRAFVLDQAPTFARFLRLVAASDAPLVFHCTAGKDRTGFAAALVLLVLDVPLPLIEQDYLLTNALYQRPARAPAFDEALMQVLWTVQPLFLQTALHSIAQLGGLQAYLSGPLGVDEALRAQLRTRLLEH